MGRCEVEIGEGLWLIWEMPAQREFPLRTTTQFVCRHCFPATRGSLGHVEHLIDRYLDDFLDQDVFTSACGRGAPIIILEWLLARVAPRWYRAVHAAAQGGHLHVVEWMLAERQDGRGPNKSGFYLADREAARVGHLKMLKRLHESGVVTLRSFTMEMAARNGHAEVVKWLDKYGEGWSNEAIRSAAEGGHLELVQRLYAHNPRSLASEAMISAAHYGHLEVMQWLYSRGCYEYMETALEWAAHGAHLDVMQWLYDRGVRHSPSSDVVNFAVRTGNLDVVKWLHQRFSSRFSFAAMDNAAREGHLHVVEWLHENRSEGCTTNAMDGAACYGHLEVVKWLHENRREGCTTEAMDSAAYYKHLNVVKWLQKNRSEGCSSEGYLRVAQDGNAAVIRFLYDNNVCRALGMELRAAADKGHLEMLKVLIEKGEVDGNTLLAGHLIDRAISTLCKSAKGVELEQRECSETVREALNWFHIQDYKVCVSSALNAALRRGQPKLVRGYLDNKAGMGYHALGSTAAGFECLELSRWLAEQGYWKRRIQ